MKEKGRRKETRGETWRKSYSKKKKKEREKVVAKKEIQKRYSIRKKEKE